MKRPLILPAALAALAFASGCLHAPHAPNPLSLVAGEGKDPAALLAQARASFALRPDLEAVRQADSLFLAAAFADPGGIEGLYGAILTEAWLVEHEPDPKARAALAASAVQAGRWCDLRAKADPRCDYGVAIALGLEARENPSTALEALKLIVERLRGAAATDPTLDAAGPGRVLALILLRAPGWPLGLGDPEAALVEAKRAAGSFPDHPPNQLALAEALIASGAENEGRAAAQRAVTLATAGAAAADPDAPDWLREAKRLLARCLEP